MTSNEHYGLLNALFDSRAAQLRELGFVYERIEEYDIAVFILRKPIQRKPYVIQTAMLHHADSRSWNDELARAKTYTGS